MTSEGGVICELGYGKASKITPAGDLPVLHIVHPTADDGAAPLIQGTNGNPYGTTSRDGANGTGTVFGLDAGRPFRDCPPGDCPPGVR